jgi:4-carboxymuconolactone decarboxylase
MKKPAIIIAVAMSFASVVLAGSGEKPKHGDGQTVFRAEEQQSFKGPTEWFTGNAHIEMVFPSNETAHYSGAYVTFQPGARTAWHLHPAGQHVVWKEKVTDEQYSGK